MTDTKTASQVLSDDAKDIVNRLMKWRMAMPQIWYGNADIDDAMGEITRLRAFLAQQPAAGVASAASKPVPLLVCSETIRAAILRGDRWAMGLALGLGALSKEKFAPTPPSADHVRDEAVTVPEGWKLVPVKPTGDMLDAMLKPWYDQSNRGQRETLVAAYRAMLAAAPMPLVVAADDPVASSDIKGITVWLEDLRRAHEYLDAGKSFFTGKDCAELADLLESLARPQQAASGAAPTVYYGGSKEPEPVSFDPASTVVPAGERDAFESWWRGLNPNLPPYRRDMAGSDRLGEYCAQGVQDQWSAWQARAAHPRQPAGVASVPAAVREWHAAWQGHIDATANYNARVKFARANEGHNIGSIKCDIEYHLMTEAKNKVLRLQAALFDGIGAMIANTTKPEASHG